jgi:UDP-N-acetylglucosamine 2-epimerase (non-hydrolysing)
VHTGQHFDDNMSRAFLDQLHIADPHQHLDVGGTTRGAQIGNATVAIERFLLQHRPGAVIVQGDTNSALGGALAANAAVIPLAHLEAGLRSYDRAMPEEHNRVVIDALADLCLAPHVSNAEVLRREGVAPERIRVTGSTLIDALALIMPEPAERAAQLRRHRVQSAAFVLATIHRPENADNPTTLRAILRELVELPLPVVLPLHPRTRKHALEFGLQPLLDCLQACEPIGYREFVSLAKECALIISDSGGVQEEATIVKRPVLVVRNSTERPEILGTFAHLVAAGPDIGRLANELLGNIARVHAELEALPYPYGNDAVAAVIGALGDLAN